MWKWIIKCGEGSSAVLRIILMKNYERTCKERNSQKNLSSNKIPNQLNCWYWCSIVKKEKKNHAPHTPKNAQLKTNSNLRFYSVVNPWCAAFNVNMKTQSGWIMRFPQFNKHISKQNILCKTLRYNCSF